MSVRLWDIATSSELLLQEGHSRPTYGVSMHPDGSLLATSDLGGVVRVRFLLPFPCSCGLKGSQRHKELTFEF
eukprot:1851885-Amphidinium_carterae.1